VSEQELKQRLAAILAADASGYSRLMAADERATIAVLDSARAVFRKQIESNQGRVIDTAGDSVLAVFETAAGAVSAALAIQTQLAAASRDTSEEKRLRFRIGVHIGDVIEKADGTIYGDGVNIAARIQALAEPGGFTVSGMVHEAVRDRVAVVFADQGEHAVKNIARPVRVYQAQLSTYGIATAPGATTKPVQAKRRQLWRIWTPAALLLVVAIGAWITLADSARNMRVSLATLFGIKSPQATSTRASIAVMPFANHSGDPKRDYFGDGISEDIVNALGRFSGVMVIAHNTVRAYKGRTVSSVDIGRELNVRYIAQGSVREADGQLRVTVELSDAEKGVLLWSERFEGSGQQVFEIQDRIVKNVVGTLAVKLTRIEQQRAFSKPTDNLEAYDLVLRARSLISRTERTANREARTLLAQALKLAPNYAAAYVALGEAEIVRVNVGWVEDAREAIKRGEAMARKALAIDDPGVNARAHGLLGSIHTFEGKYDQALTEVDRAIELNGSDSNAYASRGSVLLWQGRIEESIASTETALRFDPQLQVGAVFNLVLGYYMAGRYRDAIALADRALNKTPDFFNLDVIRAAAFVELGDTESARLTADKVRHRSPFFAAESYGTRFNNAADREKLQASLRKAGL
jgi:adenylate cyclase